MIKTLTGKLDYRDIKTWVLTFEYSESPNRVELIGDPRFTAGALNWHARWAKILVALYAALGAGAVVVAAILVSFIPGVGPWVAGWVAKLVIAGLGALFGGVYAWNALSLPQYSLCPPQGSHPDCPSQVGTLPGCPNKILICLVLESRFAAAMYYLNKALWWITDDLDIEKNLTIEIDYNVVPC